MPSIRWAKQKLTYYGHVKRSNGLEKVIMKGRMGGGAKCVADRERSGTTTSEAGWRWERDSWETWRWIRAPLDMRSSMH